MKNFVAVTILYTSDCQIGEFGVVYKGYMRSGMTDTVAIKTLKGIENSIMFRVQVIANMEV